jgi:hypothetical protein
MVVIDGEGLPFFFWSLRTNSASTALSYQEFMYMFLGYSIGSKEGEALVLSFGDIRLLATLGQPDGSS